MIRFAVWLFSMFWLVGSGALISAPAAAGRLVPPLAAQQTASVDSLSDLLPDGSIASVRVPSGWAVWDSSAGRRVRALAEESGLMRESATWRGLVKLATGTDPEQVLRFLLGGELAFALYERAPTQLAAGGRLPRELLALARTGDEAGLKLALDALLAAVSREHDVRHLSYGGLHFARVDRKLFVAAVDGVLFATTDADLLTATLDRALQSGSPAATAARPIPGAAGTEAAATLASFSIDAACVQPSDLRAVQKPGRKLLGSRVANPLANLLFGGLTLAEGRIEGSLSEGDGELSLHAVLPEPPVDAPTAWFPPGADDFGVPTTPQTVAVASTRRDLADWWRHRETLMPADTQAALAKADENIGVLFAGLSPAEDVFAAVAPELALVVDRQLFEGAALVPTVRLPAFCLVGRLLDGPQFTDSLAVAFQSMVSIMNMERAQDGRPPFVLDVIVHEGVPLRTARLAPRAADGPEALGTDPNWSPTMAVVDDWLLIGSSAEQVRRLVSSIHGGPGRGHAGTLGLDVDVSAAVRLARENRGALVANRMLEEGMEPEVAGTDIDNFLHALSTLTRVRADVRRAATGLNVDITASFAPAGETSPAVTGR